MFIQLADTSIVIVQATSSSDESETEVLRIPFTLSPLDSCRGGASQKRGKRRRKVRDETRQKNAEAKATRSRHH